MYIYKVHFLIIKAHFWSSHIRFLNTVSYAFNKKPAITPRPYLNFSKAATHCPAWLVFFKMSDVTGLTPK